MFFFWLFISILSLGALVKGADWLLGSSEKIGVTLGLSPFLIGVIIVGFGTSFPELLSSLVAVSKGITEFVPANAVGSNIANIFLVIGVSAIVGRGLRVKKTLTSTDSLFLAIATIISLAVIWDYTVTKVEAMLLVASYGMYIGYIFLYENFKDGGKKELLPEVSRPQLLYAQETIKQKPKIFKKDVILFAIGILSLLLGANYLIESLVKISEHLGIAVGVLSLALVALGTSSPELIVSLKAVLKGKHEIVLGNIFGSNVFNLLVVVGIPGLFHNLAVDEKTITLGIPVLVGATILFIFSGIIKKIRVWDGILYILLYLFFIGKLFDLL